VHPARDDLAHNAGQGWQILYHQGTVAMAGEDVGAAKE
jgi:hypothetical protein